MFNWRTNELKLLCLKYFGNTCSAKVFEFLTMKPSPFWFQKTVSWLIVSYWELIFKLTYIYNLVSFDQKIRYLLHVLIFIKVFSLVGERLNFCIFFLRDTLIKINYFAIWSWFLILNFCSYWLLITKVNCIAFCFSISFTFQVYPSHMFYLWPRIWCWSWSWQMHRIRYVPLDLRFGGSKFG